MQSKIRAFALSLAVMAPAVVGYAQQGTQIPGTPGPLSMQVVSTDPSGTCTNAQVAYFSLKSYTLFVCAPPANQNLNQAFTMSYRALVSGGFTPGIGTAIASANTIAPTSAVHHITGTTVIKTITVPTGALSGSKVTLVFDAVGSWDATGNIAVASANCAPGGTAGSQAIVAGQAYTFVYDAGTAKWYPIV